MRVLSLFSGAGGLDLGLAQAGNTVVWANDIDKCAVETYRHNVGNEIVCSDIADVDIAGLPNVDVVVGGFPCQGFSMANLRRNVDDDRNLLYKFFLTTVVHKQPRFFIAENVKGILSLDDGNAIKKVLNDFEQARYLCEKHLVNMADYGVPQTRQRVFIVGQRRDLGNKMMFSFPMPTHSNKGMLLPWVTIQQALEKYPNPDTENSVLNHIYSAYRVEYRNFTGHRKTAPNKPSPTILARGNGKGGVCAIPHYNGIRRLTVRESAAIQTFPDDFYFIGSMNSCYRQIGNAVPVVFARLLGDELIKLESEVPYENCVVV